MINMKKIFQFLNLFNKKYYGHIISLGYNCEISFQFFLKYHFVESSLFAWVNNKNCKTLINALNNLDTLTTKGFKKDLPMFIDVATDIAFHSKENRTEPENEIIDEIRNRVLYLKEKFKRTAQDGKKNLYIFKYPPLNFSSQTATHEIISLYETLKSLVQNDFDLLVISEKHNKIIIPNSMNNIFVRYVKFYTPENRVTSKPYDKKHFKKIFSEFCPSFKLTKTKKFKFEATKDK